MSFKSSRASSSFSAVVTMTMFMPRSLSILSYSISGKMSDKEARKAGLGGEVVAYVW